MTDCGVEKTPRMLLTDYLYGEPDLKWQYAKQGGVCFAAVRAPEKEFELANAEHWRTLCERYQAQGFKPLVLEPLPNALHDHIKVGDAQRDACIETFLKMLPILSSEGIRTVCTNFMAYTGWYRTGSYPIERGGAVVTEFNHTACPDREPLRITQRQLWDNLEYFLKAAVPELERWGVRLALHPDDPPVARLLDVERILTSRQALDKALHLADSACVGITLCQGCIAAMGENVTEAIRHFGAANQIFFVHFRDIRGKKEHFRETFHDNGQTDMAQAIHAYQRIGYSGPVRVDHVPTMAGEQDDCPGYAGVGRLYALGYLKGLLEASQYTYQ